MAKGRQPARNDYASERKASDALDPKILAKLGRQKVGKLGRFTVMTVRGHAIRDIVDPDWTDGGNPSRYGYQPDLELWIEGEKSEWGAFALHEYLEAVAMLGGDDYETAHDDATGTEKRFRAEHPNGSIRDAWSWIKDRALEERKPRTEAQKDNDRWESENGPSGPPRKPTKSKALAPNAPSYMAGLTPEQRSANARRAGQARQAKLTPEQRSALGRKGHRASCASVGLVPATPCDAGYHGAACGELITPSGEERVCYAVRPLESLVTSHNPETWQTDPRYPIQVQERDYTHDREEQAKVGRIAKRPNPRLLLSDNPTSTDGPPIVTGAGLVLGGNGRTMGLRRAYALGTAGPYVEALVKRAPAFGLTGKQVKDTKDPVLVRVVKGLDAASQSELAAASSRFNESLTGSLDERAKGVADSRRLSAETLSVIGKAIETHETLRKAMAEEGRTIVARLRADDLITPQTSAAMVDGAGGLTEAGKQRVEGAFLGLVAGTPERLAQASGATLGKLERIVPYLAQVRAANPAADAIEDFQQALDLLHAADAAKMSIDQFIHQGSLL